MTKTYLSKYSNGKRVSAAQYITELICENKAIRDKLDLHYKFWTTKKWSMFFRNQIASANKLLKEYDPEAIIKALVCNDGRKIYSLRAPHLKAIIDKCAVSIKNANKTFTKQFDRNTKKSFRESNINPKNIISKLKDLDNEF